MKRTERRAEIKGMKDEELDIELKSLRDKLHRLRVQSVSEKVEDNSQFRTLRRDIARVITEQGARRAAAAAG
ncbi:MAG: 50S ribosomal protein L29 [Planctomycetota bacterium]